MINPTESSVTRANRFFLVEINSDHCKGCGLCIWACQKGLIKQADNLNASGLRPYYFEDPEGECRGCLRCGVVCPEAAVSVRLCQVQATSDAV